MGSLHRPWFIALPLLAAFTAVPLVAQTPTPEPQDAPVAPTFSLPPAGTTAAPDANRQGPEIDVYRDPVTPRATPPVIAPTVTPPPAASQPAPSQPATTQLVPSQGRATPPAASTPRSAQPTPAETAPASGETSSPETTPAASAPQETPVPAPVPQPDAIPVPDTSTAPAPDAPAATPATGTGLLPWLAGIGVVLAGLALLLLRRRRGADRAMTADPVTVDPVEIEPAPEAAPEPAIPSPPPAPAVAPVAPPADTARPWIDMDLMIGQARYSLVGVTIAYTLILHNRGTLPAHDLLVRGAIGNAGAGQQAMLEQFFTGADGMPLHSAVALRPGDHCRVEGELRLPPDRIEPVAMNGRSLLIPVAAFDLAYRWDGAADAQGRTARAFIVGQEQEPPADRLAPLRMDQGPRQFRRPAARAVMELTPA